MKQIAIVLSCFCLLTSCDSKSSRFEIDEAYLERYEAIAGMSGAKGPRLLYLRLVGLFELDSMSDNSFGSDPNNTHVLDIQGAPSQFGMVNFQGDSLIFQASDSIGVSTDSDSLVKTYNLTPPADDFSDKLHHQSYSWFTSSMGDNKYLRISDTLSQAVREFKGFERFAPTAEFIFEARVNYFDEPRVMTVPTILGDSNWVEFLGSISFDHQGQIHQLHFQKNGFLMFRDETAGEETYGAGRYLRFNLPPTDSTAVLDFNYAYNPPCSFSEFTICSFPPPENWLPIAIMAGERYQSEYH